MEKVDYRKTFFILWLLAIVGSWAVLPYILFMIPSAMAGGKLFLFTTIQTALFFGIVCWLSSWILPKTDLTPFRLPSFSSKNGWRSVVYPAVMYGGLVGLALFLFNWMFFSTTSFSQVHPPLWAGALASLYGAINEEILMRLFLLTLIYFTLNKLFHLQVAQRRYALWMATVAVALLFGLGHLPAAFKICTPSALEIGRILFLNGMAGIVFGWLYWSRGLWTAMLAHFVADLVIHVILI